MIRHLAAAAALALLFSPCAARASEKTVVLDVTNVGCATCAPIVKAALSRVPGVAAVAVKEAGGSSAVATVTFDDGMTDVPTLIAATTNAGYPSQIAN